MLGWLDKNARLFHYMNFKFYEDHTKLQNVMVLR